MIKINNIKLPVGYQEEMVTIAIAKKLNLKNTDGIKWRYYRKSIDARRKDHIRYNLSVLVSHPKEKNILQHSYAKNDITAYMPYRYSIPIISKHLKYRPVVVGFGSAGMFAALLLAKAGLQPLVLERGKCIEERKKMLQIFGKIKIYIRIPTFNLGKAEQAPFQMVN